MAGRTKKKTTSKKGGVWIKRHKRSSLPRRSSSTGRFLKGRKTSTTKKRSGGTKSRRPKQGTLF